MSNEIKNPTEEAEILETSKILREKKEREEEYNAEMMRNVR